MRAGVLEGDVAGSLDADRLAHLHIPVVQLNTDAGFGGECHLDANMVRSALPALDLDALDLLIVENVGNLVCPAEFRIGEDARIMVSSVAEGADKPLKYPLMFRACELVVVNKIDLVPYVDFDMERFLQLRGPGPSRGAHAAGERPHRGRRRRAARLARAAARPGGGTGMTTAAAHELTDALEARAAVNATFFERQAGPIAELCHAMAICFARGGRLLASGVTPADASDVRHVAVEFVHPVIVGKRALPALGLDPATIALIAGPDDILMHFAGGRMAVTAGTAGSWTFDPAVRDPFVAQEVLETTYHVLWELVHVFFEHRGLLGGARAAAPHDGGASSFLYPFLSGSENDLEGVLSDVRASVARQGRRGHRAARRDGRGQRAGDRRRRGDAAPRARRAAARSSRSATAARPPTRWTSSRTCAARPRRRAPRRALDLTEDPAILTAIANDVGHDAVFSRQVIAHGA